MEIEPPFRQGADAPVEGSPLWMDAPLTVAFLSAVVNAMKRGDAITLKKILPVEPPLPSMHHLLTRELRAWFPKSHHLEYGWERVGDSDDEDAGSGQETYVQDTSAETEFRKSGEKNSVRLTLNQEEENYLVELALAIRRDPKGMNREDLMAVEPPLPPLYIEILARLVGLSSSDNATQKIYDPRDAQDDQIQNVAEIPNGDPNLMSDREAQATTYDDVNHVRQDSDAQNKQYNDGQIRQHENTEESQYEDLEDSQDKDDYPEEYEYAEDGRDDGAQKVGLEDSQDIDYEVDYEDSQDWVAEADEAPLRTICKSFLFDKGDEIVDFMWIYLAYLRDIDFHDLVGMHKMLQKLFKLVNIYKLPNRIEGLCELICW